MGSIASLGIAAGGLGYLIQNYRKGGRSVREDAISSADKLTQFWKEQADGYKEMMERKDAAAADKINKLSGDLGKLQGRYDERDKQYQEVVAILKDKNPETQAFMELLTNTAKASIDFMKDQREKDQQWMTTFASITTVLNDIHKMSTSNHDMLEKEGGKDLKISAVVTKQAAEPAPAV
jgi:uncharacterized protein YydD (DUF2326 family)